MDAAQILESLMLISFGIAWPPSIIKSFRSRTTKGKSGFFLIIVAVGYISGIAAKYAGHNVTYVTYLYMLNLLMVLVDAGLYIRNLKLDAAREA